MQLILHQHITSQNVLLLYKVQEELFYVQGEQVSPGLLLGMAHKV